MLIILGWGLTGTPALVFNKQGFPFISMVCRMSFMGSVDLLSSQAFLVLVLDRQGSDVVLMR